MAAGGGVAGGVGAGGGAGVTPAHAPRRFAAGGTAGGWRKWAGGEGGSGVGDWGVEKRSSILCI